MTFRRAIEDRTGDETASAAASERDALAHEWIDYMRAQLRGEVAAAGAESGER